MVAGFGGGQRPSCSNWRTVLATVQVVRVSEVRNYKVEGLLEDCHLKKTTLRVALLTLLVESKVPLSQIEIINGLQTQVDKVDRVTVYRNLKQLKEIGLLHEVDVNQYIFCEHECDQHAHFLMFCTRCGRHQEVRDHKKIQNLTGALEQFAFFAQGDPISLRGICLTCQP